MGNTTAGRGLVSKLPVHSFNCPCKAFVILRERKLFVPFLHLCFRCVYSVCVCVYESEPLCWGWGLDALVPAWVHP